MNPASPAELTIITGPTAVGKTELSLRWAEVHDAEILSCDASLVYRGMDIGTAKPTRAERARIPHHGVDLVSVSEPYTIYNYLHLAVSVVEDVLSRGKRVLITGGTGFYLKSFFEPVVDDVQVAESIRGEVAALEKRSGLGGLLECLKALNPNGLGSLDIHNPRRVARALERCMASGQTVEALRQNFEAQRTPFDRYTKKLYLLERAPEVLEARVRFRVRAMLEAGLVNEVRSLMKQGIERNPSAASAIGYRETIAWLQSGEDSIEKLEASIVQSTLKLVKKQRTWFRTQVRVDEKINLDFKEDSDHWPL